MSEHIQHAHNLHNTVLQYNTSSSKKREEQPSTGPAAPTAATVAQWVFRTLSLLPPIASLTNPRQNRRHRRRRSHRCRPPSTLRCRSGGAPLSHRGDAPNRAPERRAGRRVTVERALPTRRGPNAPIRNNDGRESTAHRTSFSIIPPTNPAAALPATAIPL